ncbi:MAG TPA: PAS domain S-box protein, partial [Puia sp.]|nr:PAS domain S-box protein [Puia sp.]
SPESWLKFIPGAAYVTDAQGFVVFYNEASVALWGREPVLGVDRWTGAYKLYQSDGEPLRFDESPIAIALKEARPVSDVELIMERPDGSRRLILPHAKPIFDSLGRVTGAVNILTDITDLKNLERRAEESEQKLMGLAATLEEKVKVGMAAVEMKHHELKQSEERYHKMIAEVEDYAILLLDQHGIIQNWNMGAEKIKGYKDVEIVGRHFRVFYTQGDRESGLPERLIDEASRKGKAIHEGWRQRKDGTLFWGSIVITALHAQDGEVIGFSKVTRDLTARRVSEERLRRYSRDLEFQNRELQQFAYAAAHDMKEPLRKLRFYNTSVFDSLKDKLSAKEEQYLTRATGAAIRMQTLIDDLLAYSKASTEGGAFSWVNLADIAADAEVTYQDTMEDSGAKLVIGEMPVVFGIAFQLRQLFENLLGNALKYRDPERTPVIRIFSEKNYYSTNGTIASDDDGHEYFKITVADNGIGFEKEKAEKIFDIFTRLDSRGKFPGTGIGLAICKRVLQNHRGFILADGIPGEGAAFSFFLPTRDDSAAVAED